MGKTIYQGKCAWRKRIGRRSGIRPGLKFWRIAILGVILAALPGRLSPEDRMRFRVANSRKEYRAEWILPPQNFENRSQDVYGIRICPENWEAEFYHSEEIIRPGP